MYRVPSKHSLIALTLLAAASCKPVDGAGSRILESGGTAVEWKIKTLLASTGALSIEKSGTGATDEAASITALEIEVSSAPDAASPTTTVVANQWIPLAGNTSDLKFNVLMTTRNLGLCYVNAIALNGSTDTVTCKAAGTTPQYTVNEPKRAEMERVCVRLAKEKQEGGTTPEDMVAKYDEKRNKEKCTCLSGKARDLFFGDYFAKTQPATELETDCRKMLASTDTSTDTSTAVTYEEFKKQKPAEKKPTTPEASGEVSGNAEPSGEASGSESSGKDETYDGPGNDAETGVGELN